MGYNNYEGVLIQTYVINSRNRNETLRYIEKEFADFNEFEVSIVEAGTDRIYNVAIWESLVGAVNIANNNSDDVIIICDEKHEFAAHYTKEFLIKNIIEANEQGANILLGDVDRFGHVVPLTKNRFWVDRYWCNQFIIVYKKFFKTMLDTEFDITKKVDQTLSTLTSNKMVIFPFISEQKFFGYSDVTKHNEENPNWAQNRFASTSRRLQILQKVYLNYY